MLLLLVPIYSSFLVWEQYYSTTPCSKYSNCFAQHLQSILQLNLCSSTQCCHFILRFHHFPLFIFRSLIGLLRIETVDSAQSSKCSIVSQLFSFWEGCDLGMRTILYPPCAQAPPSCDVLDGGVKDTSPWCQISRNCVEITHDQETQNIIHSTSCKPDPANHSANCFQYHMHPQKLKDIHNVIAWLGTACESSL